MSRSSCRSVEPLLALAAGGDLSAPQSAAVEEHLRTCGACRAAAEFFAATVHTVRELPALRVSLEENAEVRREVWSRIEARRAGRGTAAAGRRGLAWSIAGWSAAALVGVALILPWREARDAGRPRTGFEGSRAVPAADATPAPAPSIAAAAPARRLAPRNTRRPSRNRVPAPPESTEPVRLELSTSDPDVRIVWLVGSAGEDFPPASDDLTAAVKEDPE